MTIGPRPDRKRKAKGYTTGRPLGRPRKDRRIAGGTGTVRDPAGSSEPLGYGKGKGRTSSAQDENERERENENESENESEGRQEWVSPGLARRARRGDQAARPSSIETPGLARRHRGIRDRDRTLESSDEDENRDDHPAPAILPQPDLLISTPMDMLRRLSGRVSVALSRPVPTSISEAFPFRLENDDVMDVDLSDPSNAADAAGGEQQSVTFPTDPAPSTPTPTLAAQRTGASAGTRKQERRVTPMLLRAFGANAICIARRF